MKRGICGIVFWEGGVYHRSMAVAEKLVASAEQYLAWEREADFRSEFIAGEIFAMAGTTLNHNLISMNLSREISTQLKDRPCRVIASDMKVQVEVADAYFYPDLSGLCGIFDLVDERKDIYRNPQFIIEILSDGTEAYDRGNKFLHYQTLASLKEYVLVSQNRKVVEVYRRDGDRWIYEALDGEDAVLKLESVGCEVPLSEVYGGVEFSGAAG